MPTATSFTALGRGNGFSFCPSKINVSNYARWITLGGTQKGNSATNSEIQTSFVNAVKIFWNTNQPDGSPNTSKGGGLGDIIIRTDGSTGDPLEPINRACRLGGAVYSDSGTSGDDTFTSSFSMGASISLGIFRMYDGPTDNEDNFVGYGWSGIHFDASVDDSPGQNAPADAEAGDARSSVQMQSALFSLDPSPYPDPAEFAYTTISGIPIAVLVSAHADQSAVDGSSSVSRNASSASASGSYSNDFCSGSVSTNITGLDFYTY